MHKALLVAALAGLSACATNPAVSGFYRLNTDARNQCEANCKSLGMSLDAVVVILSSTGCVCTLQPSGERSATSGASAASGGAAVFAARAAAAQQQSQ